MKTKLPPTDIRRCPLRCRARALAAAVCLLPFGAATVDESTGGDNPTSSRTLEETRLTMDKWIESQQIISKERKEWQQGKEVLTGRLELIKNEIASLEDKIKQAASGVTEADRKRDELLAENEKLKVVGAQLNEAVAAMEGEVRRLFKSLPDPTQAKLQPLSQRMPDDPTNTKISAAERFQNVLGIMNEVNKSNNEITVSHEVHNLANGTPSEVQAIYVGLAQAYYVSTNGDAGIGRPTPDGWKWEPSKALANDVLMAVEIIQGKHSPRLVPLPVKLQ